MIRSTTLLCVALTSLVLCGFSAIVLAVGEADSVNKTPEPKLVTLDPSVKEYMRVLGGPPETVTMRSGFVVLGPGKSVGTHNTENYEEVLVVLEGEGNMVIADEVTLRLAAGTVAYCPPRTEHNVLNVGSGDLKYVYIVANAE